MTTQIHLSSDLRSYKLKLIGPIPPVGSAIVLSSDPDGRNARANHLVVKEINGDVIGVDFCPAYMIPGSVAGDFIVVDVERTVLLREHQRMLERLRGEIEGIQREFEALGLRIINGAR